MTDSFFPSFPGDGVEWADLDVTPAPLIPRRDPPWPVRPGLVPLSVELGWSDPSGTGTTWARD